MLIVTRSKPTKEKIGIEQMRVSMKPQLQTAFSATGLSGTELLQEFDRLCQNADERGLASCAKALTLISQRYQHVSCVLDSTFGMPGDFQMLNIDRGTTLMFNSNMGTGRADIVIFLPRPRQLNVSAPSKCESIIDITCLSLHCSFRANSTAELGVADGRTISALDELNILTQMCFSVIENVLMNVDFDSFEAIPTTLAQGILRAVRFPNPSIGISKIELAVEPIDSQLGRLCGTASWSTEVGHGSNRSESISMHPSCDQQSRVTSISYTDAKAGTSGHQVESLLQTGRLAILDRGSPSSNRSVEVATSEPSSALKSTCSNHVSARGTLCVPHSTL